MFLRKEEVNKREISLIIRSGRFTNYRTDVVLADKKTGKAFEEIQMTQIYVSLPLFELNEDECKTPFERWIFTLKHMDIFDKSPFKEDKAVFDRLLDVANVEALNDHERAVYEENLKLILLQYLDIN